MIKVILVVVVAGSICKEGRERLGFNCTQGVDIWERGVEVCSFCSAYLCYLSCYFLIFCLLRRLIRTASADPWVVGGYRLRFASDGFCFFFFLLLVDVS